MCKSVFLIFCKFGSNTVCITNGETQCLAPLSRTKPKLKHNCKLDDLGASFEIAKGYRIGHVTEVNFQDAVRQGGLF